MWDNRGDEPSKSGSRGHGRRARAPPKLIVLCGPSHAGKSTFAWQHLKGYRIVSTDGLRKRLGTAFVRSRPEPEVWKAFEAGKRRALWEGVSVVLDACHMSERARGHALEGPNARHRKVCIVFDVPLKTVLARCRKTGRVRLGEVERMWRAFQASKPSAGDLLAAGYDEVRLVREDGEPILAAQVTGRSDSGSAAPGAGPRALLIETMHPAYREHRTDATTQDQTKQTPAAIAAERSSRDFEDQPMPRGCKPSRA